MRLYLASRVSTLPMTLEKIFGLIDVLFLTSVPRMKPWLHFMHMWSVCMWGGVGGGGDNL